MDPEKKTLEEYFKDIDESNAAFMVATREEKRVQIARDVLAQLKIGRIVPRSTYLESPTLSEIGQRRRVHGDPVSDENKELRDVLRQDHICWVCGIGSIFLAMVDRLDAYKVEKYFSYMSRRAFTNYIEDEHHLFAPAELDYIENYFEAGVGSLTSEVRERRLESIMNLIIEKKGARLIAGDLMPDYGRSSTASY